jgi:hypothetical protein
MRLPWGHTAGWFLLLIMTEEENLLERVSMEMCIFEGKGETHMHITLVYRPAFWDESRRRRKSTRHG